MKLAIPGRQSLSSVLSVALVASAVGLAAAPSATAAEPAPAISVDKQLTQQIDDVTADNSVLIGEPVEYTLTVPTRYAGGRYAGTSRECATCHLGDDLPR